MSDPPAGGWQALQAVGRAVSAQGDPLGAGRALLRVNQPEGFDCPGCAWPDPKHTSSFEFCENGAKAVAWETTARNVDAAFFAAHTVTELRAQSDHWLEGQGRLAEPLRYDAPSDRFLPIGWSEAFAHIGARLRAQPSPDAVAFYTSGRTSNEAAFLYQLFAREFGTNNLPDCSNLCHEATSVGLPQSIGVGKGTVQLEDFERTDLLISIGHNPGTNHPRMLTTLRALARRGKPILVVNPLRERGLERFQSPQHAAEMLTGRSTALATHYLQPRIGSDPWLLQGIMKRVLELDAERGGGVLDREFIAAHTSGFDALASRLRALDWDEILQATGLTREQYATAAVLYASAGSVIVAYGMGVTQHRLGTQTVQQIANLLLLRGNIGRPGAGICPVRGHSNVQGDRTVGINERPPPWLLDAIEQNFGFAVPRHHGGSVIENIAAMARGEVRALIALGGNFAVAAPDPQATHAAVAKLDLVVGIHTKLNRGHLINVRDSLILPCLGRTEVDVQVGGAQSVSVEDSMSMVHASRGMKPPAAPTLRSEPAIVAGLAAATLLDSRVPWLALVEDYDRIRDLIARTIPGFDGYNERLRVPGGFHLRNAAAEREWRTEAGRAQFLVCEAAPPPAPQGLPLRLTTLRSHDQYNTTIYGLDDRYRGILGRRDIVFMNAADLAGRGLEAGSRVDVIARDADGSVRRLAGLAAVAYDIAPGCCACYYPEANVLVALEAADPASHTPAYKSVWVEVEAAPAA
jgi:molybdopterin-dependent oxidoreductase alpha subunit